MPGTEPMLTVRLEATGEARPVTGTLRIGRTADNDWVIDPARQPPRVSRRHCCFTATPEGCTVTDLGSVNGTSLNGRRLPPHAATPLKTGDVVELGGHRFGIEVTTRDAPGLIARETAPFPSFGLQPPDPGPPPGQPDAGGTSLEVLLRSLIYENTARIPAGNGADSKGTPSSQPHFAVSGLEDAGPPVVGVGEPGRDLWVRGGSPQNEALPYSRSEAAPVAPGDTHDSLLATFLAGAGLTPEQVGTADPAAFLREAGMVFAAMAEGYRQLLGVRNRIKADARLKRTQDGPEANNPLKDALDGQEAALALLRLQGPAYLRPRAAVRDAVQALTAHELAMLDAFQAAFADLLDAFHPRRLEARLHNTAGLSVLVRGGRRATLWELYVERYGEIARAARTRSLGAFDDAFRDAYERRADAVAAGLPAAKEDVP